MNKLTT